MDTPTTVQQLKVSLLDYGAGNVRSVRNAILANGYEIEDITTPEQILQAKVIVFPGVGSFGSAMSVLKAKKYDEPLKEYLQNKDRPFLGICLGMQTLFESSDESSSIAGLGVIPGKVVKFSEFDATTGKKLAVPHIGWNGRVPHKISPAMQYAPDNENNSVYFVHSYYAPVTEDNKDYVLSSTTYGGQRFISSVQIGSVVATQYHPEKSGVTGLNVLKGFLQSVQDGTLSDTKPVETGLSMETVLTKRIVVALDVRSNDHGDLVVTKGDQYDVREAESDAEAASSRGGVRNLGKPVALARRYYDEGADEIAFLNITSFRQGVIEDMPMLQVLEEASKNIFVPLTVGGGIRSYTDPTSGQYWSALEVAARYFRAGADKVSMGSDAVDAAEKLIANGGILTSESSIEMISKVYGVQAVVVSIDPKRVYVDTPDKVSTKHTVVQLVEGEDQLGPNGEKYCWWQCTVKGGREARDICAITVSKAVEKLGAGEIMLNCIDMDGQGKGFDLPLMRAVSTAVSIPVIASSGAGTVEHFSEVFVRTNVQAALAAGMFHRKEVEIEAVKTHMREHKVPARKSVS